MFDKFSSALILNDDTALSSQIDHDDFTSHDGFSTWRAIESRSYEKLYDDCVIQVFFDDELLYKIRIHYLKHSMLDRESQINSHDTLVTSWMGSGRRDHHAGTIDVVKDGDMIWIEILYRMKLVHDPGLKLIYSYSTKW